MVCSTCYRCGELQHTQNEWSSPSYARTSFYLSIENYTHKITPSPNADLRLDTCRVERTTLLAVPKALAPLGKTPYRTVKKRDSKAQPGGWTNLPSDMVSRAPEARSQVNKHVTM